MSDIVEEASAMTFEVTPEQNQRVDKWLKDTVYPAVIKHQKKITRKPDYTMKESWENGYPYLGAIGGGLAWCFIPTSIGLAVIVKFCDGVKGYPKFELNVTDYDSW